MSPVQLYCSIVSLQLPASIDVVCTAMLPSWIVRYIAHHALNPPLASNAII
jgi:hypothetical protein